MSFDEGMHLFKAGQYKSAAEVLQEVVTSDDQNHKAWNALGVTYTKSGRYDEAAACYAHALLIAPGNSVYLKNQALNNKKKEENGDLDPSSPPSPGGAEKKPKRTFMIVLAGIFIGMIVIGCVSLYVINSGVLSSEKASVQSDIAVAPVSSAIPLTPALSPESETRYDALCIEGIKLLSSEKPDLALRSFETAIQIEPRTLRAWTGKGYALIDLGKYESAITAFDTALKLNATDDNAKAGREIALEASGKSP